MKVLTIIRGLPGSGKTSLARALQADAFEHGADIPPYFEADKWFFECNDCVFDGSKLGIAHEWCRENCKMAMEAELDHIIVSNTAITQKEWMPYYEMAEEYGYQVQVIDVYGTFKSVHNVPEKTMKKMEERWVPFDRKLLRTGRGG